MPSHTSKVVIAGAGFAGITVARTLLSRMPSRQRKSLELLVVSNRNYHLFTPLLYQVAAGLSDPYHVIQPIRQWTAESGAFFLEATVRGVDLEKRALLTDRGRIGFDYLVLCLGSETNDFGIPGVNERALFLKKLGDGEAIRNRLLECMERAADPSLSDKKRKSLLSVAIVGGGATGVELAGAIADYVLMLNRYYRSARLKELARLYLVEAEKSLVPGLDGRVSEICNNVLKRKGVEVLLGKHVSKAGKAGLEMADDSFIDASTLIWTAGIMPNPVISSLEGKGVEKKKGRIVVSRQLMLPFFPGVYVIGDCAYVDDGTGKPVPATADSAAQEGRFAGRHIAAAIMGWKKIADRNFRYRDRGTMLSLGRFEGVAVFGSGMVIDGFLGWAIWRFVHIALISTLRSKLGVLFDWTFAIFYSRTISRTDYD